MVSSNHTNSALLESELARLMAKWDRKHADYLIKIYQGHEDDHGFIDQVISIYLHHSSLEHATTWILKHFIDKGNKLSESKQNLILSKMGELDYWESQLHVLQIIPRMSLTLENAEKIKPIVHGMMHSEKKFVKAAAFEAFLEIVKLFPELKADFSLFCERAIEFESASIRSKVRKVIQQMTSL